MPMPRVTSYGYQNLNRSRGIYPFLVALLISLLHCTAFSQSPFGRRFLIAFPDTMRNSTGGIVNPLANEARIIIFSLDTANVTITSPGYTKSLRVYPDSSSVASLGDPTARPPKIFLDTLNTPSP